MSTWLNNNVNKKEKARLTLRNRASDLDIAFSLALSRLRKRCCNTYPRIYVFLTSAMTCLKANLKKGTWDIGWIRCRGTWIKVTRREAAKRDDWMLRDNRPQPSVHKDALPTPSLPIREIFSGWLDLLLEPFGFPTDDVRLIIEMEGQDEEFVEQGNAGASSTFPQQAGTIKKGGYAILKGRPCRIVDIAISKTGKHGHAKARFVGIDVFTNNKYEDMCPTSHNMEVPVVKREDFQLVDITPENFATLMTAEGETKNDLRLPVDEVGTSIRSMFDEGKQVVVSVLGAMGEEKIVAAKELREE